MTAAVASSRECSQRLFFRVGGHTLALDVQDPAALAILDAIYGPMRCEEGRTPNCTASVRRLADGRLHVRFGRRTLPVPSGTESDDRSIYLATREIFALCAAAQAGTMAFYGVLAATARGGILLLGPTAIGKTILALHMAQVGANFLGDETAIFALSTGEIAALPRRPSLRESALDWLPAALRDRVAAAPGVFQMERGRFWYGLNEEILGIAPSPRPLPLHAVCIVSGRAETAGIRPVPLAQALPMIVQRAYARPSELAQLAALRRALRRVVCYDVTLGSPAQSADALLREINGCA